MDINLDEFREDFKTNVAKLEDKYKLNISIGNITYDDISFRTKMKCTLSTVDVQKMEFEKYCDRYGFSAADYLRPFSFHGEDYILTGFNVNAKSYPAIATRIKTGERYTFRISSVKEGLSKNG